MVTLTHSFPKSSSSTSTSSAQVNIDNLLECLPSLRPKDWIHVIGYIQTDKSIQAITLFKTEEGLDLAAYEQTVKEVIKMREESERNSVSR